MQPTDILSIRNMSHEGRESNLSSTATVFGGSGTSSLIPKDSTLVSHLASDFPSRPYGMFIQEHKHSHTHLHIFHQGIKPNAMYLSHLFMYSLLYFK